ncbi:MAG: DNA-packaging protein [Henriciella sp.]
MPAPKGNQFWKARASHGRPALYDNPEALWADCEEYFEWVAEHPLIEATVHSYKGKGSLTPKPKMRAMTISGLCLFLQISFETWSQYRKKKDFIEVTSRAEAIIYNQKFAGAAADMLNANIIARDLGLSDKQELKAAIVTVLEGDDDL